MGLLVLIRTLVRVTGRRSPVIFQTRLTVSPICITVLAAPGWRTRSLRTVRSRGGGSSCPMRWVSRSAGAFGAHLGGSEAPMYPRKGGGAREPLLGPLSFRLVCDYRGWLRAFLRSSHHHITQGLQLG